MPDITTSDRRNSRHLVVVGASAGGIEALRDLVSGLPADFAAPLAVVLHTSPQSPGVLHEILDRAGPLRAGHARNGERLEPGRIYVAPPDHHLLIEPRRARLSRGPRENRFRPAIDPLFRSAAQVYGPAVIGVVLTGNLDDGAAGLWVIRQMGGTAVVQDPEDAMYPSMPLSAIQNVRVDYIKPLSAIPSLLTRLIEAPADVRAAGDLPKPVHVENRIAGEEDPVRAGLHDVADPSPFACPECHGVLLRLKEAGPMRFRCHTGHAYSLESLLAHLRENIERSLWTAVRALHEGALLVNEIAGHLREAQAPEQGAKLGAHAEQWETHAHAIRQILTDTTLAAREH